MGLKCFQPWSSVVNLSYYAIRWNSVPRGDAFKPDRCMDCYPFHSKKIQVLQGMAFHPKKDFPMMLELKRDVGWRRKKMVSPVPVKGMLTG